MPLKENEHMGSSQAKKRPLYSRYSHPKPVVIPECSCEFAEFLGMYYGDGSATENPPVVTISLSYSEEQEYASFICDLLFNMLKVKAGIVEHSKVDTVQVRVYRISSVRFLKSNVNRNQGMPDWVKGNSSFLVCFIRGVMDCESSVYRVEKSKRRIRIELKMTNKKLLEDVNNGLNVLGYHPRIYLERNRVVLARQDEVDRYFKEVCSHNPKHIKRYLSLRAKHLPTAPVV